MQVTGTLIPSDRCVGRGIKKKWHMVGLTDILMGFLILRSGHNCIIRIQEWKD